jgi:hypothetical protein
MHLLYTFCLDSISPVQGPMSNFRAHCCDDGHGSASENMCHVIPCLHKFTSRTLRVAPNYAGAGLVLLLLFSVPSCWFSEVPNTLLRERKTSNSLTKVPEPCPRGFSRRSTTHPANHSYQQGTEMHRSYVRLAESISARPLNLRQASATIYPPIP